MENSCYCSQVTGSQLNTVLRAGVIKLFLAEPVPCLAYLIRVLCAGALLLHVLAVMVALVALVPAQPA